MTDLSTKAMLVRLAAHNWTARKFDRDVSDEVADLHGSDATLGRFNKMLVPKGALRGVNQAVQAIRDHHAKNTLPWAWEGVALLPAANYFAYMQESGDLIRALEVERNLLIVRYQVIKDEAKTALADLYNEDDYPTVADLESRIGCEVTVMPLPEAGDFRVSLSKEETARVKRDIEATVNAAMQSATLALWKRVHDAVDKMRERLEAYKKDPDSGRVEATFRDSLVGNLREMVALLPRLNVTSDPQLEALRKRLEKTLTPHEPGDLRENDDLRAKAAAECRAVLATMQAYTGQMGAAA